MLDVVFQAVTAEEGRIPAVLWPTAGRERNQRASLQIGAGPLVNEPRLLIIFVGVTREAAAAWLSMFPDTAETRLVPLAGIEVII